MDEIKDRNRHNHHRPIQRNKVPLRRNQVPVPALHELDRPVYASCIDAEDGEDHGGEEGHDGGFHGLQEAVADGAADKVGGAEDEDGDGGHLEDDARDHDVCSWLCVAVFLGGLGGGHSAADGLDDKRDDVAGDEDPEVDLGTEDGGFPAEDLNQAAQEDVDACCVEGGGYCLVSLLRCVWSGFGLTDDQGGDLH